MKTRLTLGVLGGMGVQATAYFYELFTGLQTVTAEQEYADIIIYSKPSTPDRTAYITHGTGESPLPSLLHAAKTLEAAGAGCIVMPCVTSHYFYKELSRAVSVPFLNIPEETAAYIAAKGFTKAGLLATEATVSQGLFHTALKARQIEVITPPPAAQAQVMEIIYTIKRGGPPQTDIFDKIVQALQSQGAQTVILGCTELSLVHKSPANYTCAIEVLARAALRACKPIG